MARDVYKTHHGKDKDSLALAAAAKQIIAENWKVIIAGIFHYFT